LPRFRSARSVRVSLPSYQQSHQLVLADPEMAKLAATRRGETPDSNVFYLLLAAAEGQPKLGKITVRSQLPLLEHNLGEMQIWQQHDQWHGSVVIRDPVPQPAGAAHGAIGINRGVVHFATLSNGERVEGFPGDPALERWIRHRQHDASRKWIANNREQLKRAMVGASRGTG
jgi:transposase